MLRSIPILVSAILLSRPTMPPAEAQRYATVLQKEGELHDFDPFTAVAIIHYETHWRPSLVSPDGEDYGLGQIRARFVGACRQDEDPLHHPSDACLAVKAQLLVGESNIHRMAGIISANRDLCRQKTGTAWVEQWLAGYGGYNYPSQGRWCEPHDKTWRVVDYRKLLIEKLVPRPPAPLGSVAKKAAPAQRRKDAPHASGPSLLDW